MKHIFIINPVAGKGKYQGILARNIRACMDRRGLCYDIYVTKCKGDAVAYVSGMCGDGEEYRFYSCGGDGTLHEVVNGAAGCSHVSVGLVPCGSGNDFVRCFDGAENFLDVDAQVEGDLMSVDLIRTLGEYAVSVCNIGFDADAAFNMHRFKRIPLLSGSGCYIVSVLYCLMKRLGKELCVTVDDGRTIDGSFLLSVVANGSFYGGGWMCAPQASIDDGFMDMCLIRRVSRLRILSLINKYKHGLHVEDDRLRPYIEYGKFRRVKIKSSSPINLCVDGESYIYDEIEFEAVPSAMNLIVPKGASYRNFSLMTFQ